MQCIFKLLVFDNDSRNDTFSVLDFFNDNDNDMRLGLTAKADQPDHKKIQYTKKNKN